MKEYGYYIIIHLWVHSQTILITYNYIEYQIK